MIDDLGLKRISFGRRFLSFYLTRNFKLVSVCDTYNFSTHVSCDYDDCDFVGVAPAVTKHKREEHEQPESLTVNLGSRLRHCLAYYL